MDDAGGLEAVHAGHADVEQDHGEFAVHQLLQGGEPGGRAHEPVAEGTQYRLVGEEARLLVVHQQDADRLPRDHARPSDAQGCSHRRTRERSSFVLTGFAM
ncbi:hypothetical protein D3C83_63750 [compost metagenome]